MTTELQTIQPNQPSNDGGILAVIARAAADPSVDVDKLSKLLDMHMLVVGKNAEQSFNVAMNEAQKEMRPIAADAENPQTRSKYASFAKLDGALRPIYTKHGFSLSFDEGDSPKAEHIRVLCYVSHTAGYTRTYRRDMPADGKGAKGGDVMTKTHAAGAADSYGKRYLLRGVFNVAVGEDDNDGNGIAYITEDQAKEINDLIATAGEKLRTPFLKYLYVPTVPHILAKDYDKAVKKLKEKVAEKKA